MKHTLFALLVAAAASLSACTTAPKQCPVTGSCGAQVVAKCDTQKKCCSKKKDCADKSKCADKKKNCATKKKCCASKKKQG